jgi:hypothetical protein
MSAGGHRGSAWDKECRCSDTGPMHHQLHAGVACWPVATGQAASHLVLPARQCQRAQPCSRSRSATQCSKQASKRVCFLAHTRHAHTPALCGQAQQCSHQAQQRSSAATRHSSAATRHSSAAVQPPGTAVQPPGTAVQPPGTAAQQCSHAPAACRQAAQVPSSGSLHAVYGVRDGVPVHAAAHHIGHLASLVCHCDGAVGVVGVPGSRAAGAAVSSRPGLAWQAGAQWPDVPVAGTDQCDVWQPAREPSPGGAVAGMHSCAYIQVTRKQCN